MNLNILRTSDKRSAKAKKNIFSSIVLKGIDSLIYIFLVPVTLGYLNPYEYGIWLTLSSILMWINSFDIGLGNGMRNKLAAAIAVDNKLDARKYVSTTFAMLIFIILTLLFLGIVFKPFINWYDILSTNAVDVRNLNNIVFFTFTIFCINFIFKVIGNVYLAMQLPAVNNLMTILGHGISLIIIYILSKTTSGNLLWVALVYSGAPLVIYLLSYPITFYKIFPYLRPSFKFFDSSCLKDLFGISINFFLLQLSSILLFAFANLMISHMFGPEYVTPYNISYRYFSLLPMGMTIIISPMWSATTDAYVKGDIEWIRKTINTIKKILVIATAVVAMMIIFSQFVYKLWIGNEVSISIPLTIAMGLYIVILIWSTAYSNFLNGLGKLKLQTINTVIVATLFCPLSYLLGNSFGIIGIVISMILLNCSGLILNYIQFNKVIDNRASGIWNK